MMGLNLAVYAKFNPIVFWYSSPRTDDYFRGLRAETRALYRRVPKTSPAV